MSDTWQNFIASLKDAPDNVTTIPNPTVDDPDSFSTELLQISTDLAVYGATFIEPTPAWDARALAWANDTKDVRAQQDASIIAWAGRGLATGAFSSQAWFEALIGSSTRLRECFVSWAKTDLESCLSACNNHYEPLLRIPILTMILEILVSMPYMPGALSSSTAMYTLAGHPLLDTIVTSLILDTGNHLFPLGLRAILSVIPYAPQVLTPKVPMIMVILGRAVCWRDRPFVDAGQSSDSPATFTPEPRQEWRVATSAIEHPLEVPLSLQPVNIVRLWLVAIYGAWPSNLLAFVRDPVPYLHGKKANCPYRVEWEDVWPSGLLAARTGPLLREFALHPSIMYFNSDGELRDAKRWEKVDPPEHISRAHIIAHSERLSYGKTDFFDEDDYSEFHSVEVSQAPTPLEQPLGPATTDLDRLQRENILLRLELGYADRLRKQYLFHIGRLHKHSMRFSVDEAEVHSFVNRLKEQKSMIETLNNELSQHRRDASQAQQKHSKWQEQLRDKLSGFRDDKRNWQNEAASIRTERNEVETTVLRQKAELAQVKNERFKLQNQLTEVLPKVKHIEDYEIRMKQLIDTQLLWDQDVLKYKDQVQETERWKGMVYQLEQLLRSVNTQLLSENSQGPSNATDHSSFEAAPTQTLDSAPKPLAGPDLDYYIKVAQEAKERADRLEREALELRVELEKLKRERTVDLGDSEPRTREFMWGD